MDARGRRENKRKAEADAKVLAWLENKERADKEEEALRKEMEDLKGWIDMIGSMNNEQLKGYLRNRPDDLKTTETEASKAGKRVESNEDSNPSTSK